jgi:hypothetical protein
MFQMGLGLHSYLVQLDLSRNDDALKADAESLFKQSVGDALGEGESYIASALITNQDRCLWYEAGKRDNMTWEQATKFALACVANDLHLFGTANPLAGLRGPLPPDPVSDKIDALSRDELVASIRKEVPARIVAAYEALVAEIANPGTPTEAWRSGAKHFARAAMVWQFENFMSSVVPPFATHLPLPPGSFIYRAYDLTLCEPGEEPYANAILIVEIQT